MSKKVVVIGAGLGGMSAAIMLAQDGFEVVLLEKNDRLGGKLNILEKDGFSFDLGPSIFTLPQMFRPLFEKGGKTLEDYIPLKRLDPQWRNFFEDGARFDLWEDPARMKAELDRISPRAHAEFAAFADYSKAQYHAIDQGYFSKGLDTFWQFIRHYGILGLFGRSRLDYRHTMAQSVERHFSDPHLRAAFEYFIKYVGSSAYDAPGFMNLMPNIQLEFGLWYVEGGLYRVARAFEQRLSELGVEVRMNAEVTSIETRGGAVTGVVASGRRIPADVVVSNMEVVPTYRKLLHEGASFLKRLDKYKPACSGIVLHLGVSRKFPQLAHHNFFYSRDQKEHFFKVFHENRLPDDPTIYLVAPSVTDPTQAPEGCENIKILPHIPPLSDGPGAYTRRDCLDLKEKVLDKLERMGLDGLRKHTVVEDFWTPFDIEKRYNSNRGSIYGVLTDKRVNFAFKAPKQSTKYRNLYFAGGSTNPGAGMPMVVLSGRHVARMIREAES